MLFPAPDQRPVSALRVILWIAALCVMIGPCLYMGTRGGKLAGGSARMAMAMQMKQQALAFEMQFNERLGMQWLRPDPDFLKSLVEDLNAMNAQMSSPAAAAEMRKEGMNPAMMPKPIPWVLAPQKGQRTMSLGMGEGVIQIRGWGLDLEKPLFERDIPFSAR